MGARLKKAKLGDVNLRAADLRGADFRGVDLTNVHGLSTAHVRSMLKDGKTKLPKEV